MTFQRFNAGMTFIVLVFIVLLINKAMEQDNVAAVYALALALIGWARNFLYIFRE